MDPFDILVDIEKFLGLNPFFTKELFIKPENEPFYCIDQSKNIC